MPRHDETRHVRFTADQMFDLVADVEHYPDFLPWCLGTRVRDRHSDAIKRDVFLADMVIGFKMLRERYTSRVTLDRTALEIHVAYLDGPFKHLENRWSFRPDAEGSVIDFYIEFEFRSKMLQSVIGRMFHEAVRVMVNAFEKRAADLYLR